MTTMTLSEVEKQARLLMTAHGVGSLGFEFDRGKKRIGATFFKPVVSENGITYRLPTKISLSRHFAVLLTADELRDTMLHEIAHAKAGYEAGHGPKWKAEARALGIIARPCKATSARPEASVKGVCTNPDCGAVVSQMHRLPLRVYFHGKCGKAYPLRWFKNGAMLHWTDMPLRFRNEYARMYNNGFLS